MRRLRRWRARTCRTQPELLAQARREQVRRHDAEPLPRRAEPPRRCAQEEVRQVARRRGDGDDVGGEHVVPVATERSPVRGAPSRPGSRRAPRTAWSPPSRHPSPRATAARAAARRSGARCPTASRAPRGARRAGWHRSACPRRRRPPSRARRRGCACGWRAPGARRRRRRRGRPTPWRRRARRCGGSGRACPRACASDRPPPARRRDARAGAAPRGRRRER